ncbi:MAG: hypothetical protein P1U85_22520 [Verrucomicrobiales bacterium]|nr:hypothetical protein [Verrucomicrobiales bacterium]
MRPPEKVLALEKQFVRLLIVNMSQVDVGRFDFDFDTTFAVLVLNEKGQVYLRYGGRDSRSAESFVSLAAFKTALTRGLETHEKWRAGEIQLPEAGKPKLSGSYPFVANIGNRRCVHCHDVASGKAIELFRSPDFSPLRDIWIYPEPMSLGLDLDPDDGARLRNAVGGAANVGLKSGDRIVAIDGLVVHTFTDIQYRLHHLSPKAIKTRLTLEDGREVELPLHHGWRYSDITWRRLGLRLSPSAGFGGTPLPAERKAFLGLDENGFATEVSFYDFPEPEGSPLKQGDIVFSVNGRTSSSVIDHVSLYISLAFEVGETVNLGVIRNGERIKIPLVVSEPPSSDARIMDSDAKGGRKGGGASMGKGRRRGMVDE